MAGFINNNSANAKKGGPSILRVNSDTFAELISEDDNSYFFNFSFKLASNNRSKSLDDYEKVVITVSSKETEAQTKANPTPRSNQVSETQGLKDNSGGLGKVKVGITPKTNANPKVMQKLYSNFRAIEAFYKEPNHIAQVIVPIANAVQDSKKLFSVTELSQPLYRSDRRQSSSETSSIDTKDVLTRINSELWDITSPITDNVLGVLTSESHLDDGAFRRKILAYRPQLCYDIVKYYLDEIPRKEKKTENIPWYEAKKTSKVLDDVVVESRISIDKSNKNLNLVVNFELYRRKTNVIDETVVANLYMPSHVEAFEAVIDPPQVVFTQGEQDLVAVSISDKDRRKNVSGYNVYTKDVSGTGIVDNYRFISSHKSPTASFNFVKKSPLMILRVVPLDKRGKESNVFTNVVIGPGHPAIGCMVILPQQHDKFLRIVVQGVPRKLLDIRLYKRQCTTLPPSQQFKQISIFSGDVETGIYSFDDNDVVVGGVYEYRAVATLTNNRRFFSNDVAFKNVGVPTEAKYVSVKMEDPKLEVVPTSSSTSDAKLTFKLSTEVLQKEDERITNSLKEQINELYQQFMNPGTPSNTQPPTAPGIDGIPQFRDLIVHEVVRSNLTTGERETFDLINDGIFVDDSTTRRALGIKPIDPQHSYRYDVYSYKKNPIELFKKFVATGQKTTSTGIINWFYLPYKWNNPQARLGTLYADREDGVPDIDTYVSFTSESLGVQTTYNLDGATQFTSLTKIISNRVDRNTVKISWSFSGASAINSVNLYDSFVVMKEVNGIRSFVGRTFKNYIYHELTEQDLGNVSYVILPIMSEFDIDEPGYSASMLIHPEGLVPRVLVGNAPFDPEKPFESKSGKEVIDAARRQSKREIADQRDKGLEKQFPSGNVKGKR